MTDCFNESIYLILNYSASNCPVFKYMNKIILLIVIILATVALHNPAVSKAVPFGNYLEVSGGHLETNTSLSSVPSSFAFEGWVMPSTTEGYRPVISVGNAQHNYEVGLNGGSLEFDIRYSTNSRLVITAGQVPVDDWSKIKVFIDAQETVLKINDETVFTTNGASPLRPIGDKIRVGKSVNAMTPDAFLGSLDEFIVFADGTTQVEWHLDEQRGQTIASDSSANAFDALLIGGDSKIHFFGVLPTNTPRPTLGIRWTRPVLPTLRIPGGFPSITPYPTSTEPTPSDEQEPTPTVNVHDPNNRPNLPRDF